MSTLSTCQVLCCQLVKESQIRNVERLFLISACLFFSRCFPVNSLVIQFEKFYNKVLNGVRSVYNVALVKNDMMTAFESLSTSQKLRASLHRDVRAICTESLHLLGMEMTKSATDIVAELVYKKLSVYATDLEAFSKHAKRNTVNSEDVKLLVRRNPSLKTRLNAIQPSNPLAKDKRRKTVATTNSSKSITTPAPKQKDTLRPNTEGKRNYVERGLGKDLIEGGMDLGESSAVLGESGMDLGETRKDLDEGGSKIGDFLENRITNEVQDMSFEDTIDLTFD